MARVFKAIMATFKVLAEIEEKEPDRHEALMEQAEELCRLVIGHAAERKLCPGVVIAAAMNAIVGAVMQAEEPTGHSKAMTN